MSKGDITRQRIIEKAAPLFNQRGFAGCSMQDILEATGLQKGGIYRHFSSKEELAAAALEYSLSMATKIRVLPVSSSRTAAEQLRDVIERFVEMPSPIAGGCPILNTAIDADDGNQALRAMARDALRGWRTKIAEVVREGLIRKELQPDVNPVALANTIIATLEGALMMSRLEGSQHAMSDARAALEDLIKKIALKRS